MTAPTMPTLSLRQFVAAKLTDGEINYRAEALRLVDAMPPEDRDEYLAQAIIGVLTEINGQRRRDAFDAMPNDLAEGSDQAATVDHAHGVAPSAPNTARTDAHRAFWLELRDSIGLAADGGRKRVGDMNAADLQANIDYREKLAAENQHRAQQFRQLLALLESSGAETVDQIGGAE